MRHAPSISLILHDSIEGKIDGKVIIQSSLKFI